MRLYLSDLMVLAPELTVLITAIVLSLIDLILPRRVERHWLAWLAVVGLAISASFVVYFMNLLNTGGSGFESGAVELLDHSFRVDNFANLFKLFFIVGTALVIFMSIGHLKKERIDHQGEYYYLFLPATLGAMIMASSADLITLFVGLELLSITSYVLVGIRKRNAQSNEAAFKYVVTGSIATAFILYGMSFLYGMTGSTNLQVINEGLYTADPSFHAMIYLSFFLLISGLGLKIAAAPFHAWAPDVYQGSTTPVATFLAVVSKAAGFAILFRIIYNVYFAVGDPSRMPIHDDVFLTLVVLAAAAMIIGNALALKQKQLKRLLAYSGVANAGYLLVPLGIQFSSLHIDNFSELFFYLIAYLFMNIGMFAAIMVVSNASGHEQLSSFAGLYHRAPWTAVAVLILVLSLAGLPITGGFFGKLYILFGAVRVEMYWLAIVMILTSVVSYYYYFGIVRQMFIRAGDGLAKITLSKPLAITIWISVIASVLLGLFPQVVLDWIQQTFSFGRDFFIGG